MLEMHLIAGLEPAFSKICITSPLRVLITYKNKAQKAKKLTSR